MHLVESIFLKFCLASLRDFCQICTFSITLLCHRKAKESERKKKMNKRRQIKHVQCVPVVLVLFGSVLSSGTVAAGDLQQATGCSSFTGTPGKAVMKTKPQQGELLRKHLSKNCTCRNTIEVFSKWSCGVFFGHPLYVTRGRGHSVRSSENGLA